MDHQTVFENNKTYIKFFATAETPFDSSFAETLEKLGSQILSPASMTQNVPGECSVLYDVSGRLTLGEYLAASVDTSSFLMLVARIKDLIDACIQMSKPLKNVVFDYSLVYVDAAQDLLQFIYLPFGNLPPDLGALTSFLRDLPEKASFSNIESFNLAATYAKFFQKTGPFSLEEFTHFVEDMCQNNSTCKKAEGVLPRNFLHQTQATELVSQTVDFKSDEDASAESNNYSSPVFPGLHGIRPAADVRATPPTGVLNQVSWINGVPECLHDEKKEALELQDVPKKSKAHETHIEPTTVLDEDDDVFEAVPKQDIASGGEVVPKPLHDKNRELRGRDDLCGPRYFLRRQKTGELCEIKGSKFVVGKSKYSSFQVRDTRTVSRSHALFTIKDNGTCWMEDNASKNGTSVDGIYLRAHEPVELRYGQVVRMSDEDFIIVESTDLHEAQKESIK